VADTTGLQLRSLITKSGELELSLKRLPIPEPAADEVVVRVEGTPINPSDLGLLTGPADPATFKSTGSGADVVVTAKVPEAALGGALDDFVGAGIFSALLAYLPVTLGTQPVYFS